MSSECDIPKLNIDTKLVFPTIRQNYPKKANVLISKAFVLKDNIYDFGPLLIGKEWGKQNDNLKK